MSPLAPLAALLAALPKHRRTVIERELRLRQSNEETPRERRNRTLLPLAQMLAAREPNPGLTFPLITEEAYERERPAGAPTADWTAEKFDGWILACRAAYGLKGDGSWDGARNPWPNPQRDKLGQPPFTRKETLRAIRRCARELGLAPSSTTYDRWAIRKRQEARGRGVAARLPRAQQIYRHFPADDGGYNAALAAAAINVTEVLDAQADRLGHERGEATATARDALAEMTDGELTAAGVDRASVGLIRAERAGELPYSQAAKTAATLGGSLEWLAGEELHRGEPASGDARFNAQTFETQRHELEIPRGEILALLRLDLGRYKRFVSGRFEPTLDEAIQLRSVLRSR